MGSLKEHTCSVTGGRGDRLLWVFLELGQGVGERFSLALLGVNGTETGSSVIFSLHSPPFFFFLFLFMGEGSQQQHRIWGQHLIYLHCPVLLSSGPLFWGAFSIFIYPGQCSSYFTLKCQLLHDMGLP